MILCLLFEGCKVRHSSTEFSTEKRHQEGKADAVHAVALESFVTSNNYNGASLYLERRTVPYDIRIQFIDFLMKGAMQKGVSAYNPAALGLSIILERGDVSPSIAASIMDILYYPLSEDTILEWFRNNRKLLINRDVF